MSPTTFEMMTITSSDSNTTAMTLINATEELSTDNIENIVSTTELSTDDMENIVSTMELTTETITTHISTTTTTTTTTTIRTTTTTMTPPNLLINPGAESGSDVGWNQVGSSPVIIDSNGQFNNNYYPNSGTYCFAGGNGPNSPSKLVQNVNLLGGIQGFTETQLDLDSLRAEITFYYQTWDRMFIPHDLVQMSAGPSAGNSNALIVPIYDKIPLSHLLDAAVQKTYHELYTMADVLHSKSNLERKIELIKFACRVRQLFIRILAVVKWAATTGKVTACEDIQNFLELRARLIRETSDSLAQLAREKLLEARVPSFPVTDAIDAMTLGSVNFLPKRIAEVATSFTPATESERQKILPRLQQILTARISTSELPIQFTTVIIKNGLVTLTVDREFEVKLGITNDNLSSPWRLYQTKLFLQDPEEPDYSEIFLFLFTEQDLVHPMQIQLLTNYVQSWLNESEKPLVDLYNYLHYYCQSLGLQVLFEQAHRIRNQGAKQKDLHISGYNPCKSFYIEYWKDYTATINNNPQKKQIFNGKNMDIGMTIICDDNGKYQIQHWPPLPIDDSVAILKVLEKPIFTMEEILNRTIYARCQRRFEELKETILSTTIANSIYL
ncbi:unnamed protein product [Rotaria sp. Silwood2]|nr:unnamed protein product [Rotaria sp. Silwood2]